MITVLPIQQLTEQQWRDYFDFFRRITHRYMPRDWVGEWKTFRDRRLASLSVLPSSAYVFFDTSGPLAWLRCVVEGDRLCFYWGMGPGKPDPPFIQAWFRTLVTDMDRFEHKRAFIESYIPQTQVLANQAHATRINQRYCYSFFQKTADFRALEMQVATCIQQHTGYQFLLYRDRPDEMLEAYVALYDRVAQDIPRSDKSEKPYASWRPDALRRLNQSNRLTGNTTYTGVIFSPAGQMVALTDVNLHSLHTQRLYQGMTGVHPDYRGRGLAVWLKLMMLLRLYQDFPDFEQIDTDCNALNVPMQRLNESVGYVRSGEGAEYRFEREDILRAIRAPNEDMNAG